MTRLKLLLIVAGVTASAFFVGNLFPILGPSTTAIVLGMILAHQSFLRSHYDLSMMKHLGSFLLKLAIVLLGLTLSLDTLTGVGLESLRVTLGVVVTSFLVVQIVGRWMKVDEDTRLLLGMGTAICGGSAIATAAPIIDAEDDAIAMSLTTVFWYNLLALFVFPFLGELLHYSALQFGIFAGAAINDTSSVVAAGFEHSDVAGDIATITKLVRTVLIVPVSLILLLWQIRRSVVHSNQKISFKVVIRLVPSFIYGFLASILLATLLPLPETFVTGIKDLSKIIMTAALVAIGLTIEGSQFKKAGFRPILLGGITWSAVILVAILLIHIFY